MKISLNWLKELIDIDREPEEIANILTSLGLEVEGWERISPSPVDLERVFTAEVVSCARIPNTDHLSATQVDVGDGRLRSVVCGAPNVAAGQRVLVALPGARVLSKEGQLFTIAERKVRGVLSEGMICAEDELGLGADHSGIMVLPEGTPVGQTAAEYLGIHSDVVFEIGLTPNRSDAMHHIGIVRDLLAWMRYREGSAVQLRLPEAKVVLPKEAEPFPVRVEAPEACQRYTALLIRGVRVQESPAWLKSRLLALGQRPVNNVVDITNYVRLERGHPLHAFDAERIGGGAIRVKMLPEGTPFVTLDGETRRLSGQDLMICDAQDRPMCMAGVFGGADSGITEATVDVLLECARFHPTTIRRTMLRHGLRTDSAKVFEKGVDPNGCADALMRAAALVLELAGGQLASAVADVYPQPVQPLRVPMTYEYVRRLSGADLSEQTIERILLALEFGVEESTPEGFVAVVPTRKPDVARPADIVEEVLRIYGLDEVPLPTRIHTSVEVTQHPTREAVRKCAADFLAANGFWECMSLSLSNSAYYVGPQALLPIPREQLVFVHNTANQGLDCMRPSLLFSALENLKRNQSVRITHLRLFELGKVYRAPLDEAAETEHLSLLLWGDYGPESWQPKPKQQADFYTLKAHICNLLQRLGIRDVQEVAVQDELPFRYGLRYCLDEQVLVTFGELSPTLLRAMDVGGPAFYAEADFEALYRVAKARRVRFVEPSKYPSVRRDLALVLDRSVPFAQIQKLAFETESRLLREVNLFDVFEDAQKIGPGKKSYAVSFLFESAEHTLRGKEVEAIMQQLQAVFEQKLQAIVRK